MSEVSKMKKLTLDDIDPQELERLIGTVTERVINNFMERRHSSCPFVRGIVSRSHPQELNNRSDGVRHPGVICDSCDQLINSTRYKCLGCHDYDLCENCMHQPRKKHNPRHSWLMMNYPLESGSIIQADHTVDAKDPKEKKSSSPVPERVVVEEKISPVMAVPLVNSPSTSAGVDVINVSRANDNDLTCRPTVSQEMQVPESGTNKGEKSPPEHQGLTDLGLGVSLICDDDDAAPSGEDDDCYDHEFEMINPNGTESTGSVYMNKLLKSLEPDVTASCFASNKAGDKKQIGDENRDKNSHKVDTSFYMDSSSTPEDFCATSPFDNDVVASSNANKSRSNAPLPTKTDQEDQPIIQPVTTAHEDSNDVSTTTKTAPGAVETSHEETPPALTSVSSVQKENTKGSSSSRDDELAAFESPINGAHTPSVSRRSDDQMPLVDVWPETLSRMLNVALAKIDGTLGKIDGTSSRNSTNLVREASIVPSLSPSTSVVEPRPRNLMSETSAKSLVSSNIEHPTGWSTRTSPPQPEVLTQQPTKVNVSQEASGPVTPSAPPDTIAVSSSTESSPGRQSNQSTNTNSSYDVDKMMRNLSLLREMGFVNRQVNGALLLKHDHNLPLVIEELFLLNR